MDCAIILDDRRLVFYSAEILDGLKRKLKTKLTGPTFNQLVDRKEGWDGIPPAICLLHQKLWGVTTN
jgi:hypothetical protein